uniref:Uncharacterized protein n=1 Tax=Caulobacter sp. (strain K31) TaxID=366602 RepID=B0T9C3_CAUSK
MTSRYFNLDDTPTTKNLGGLDHLSRQHCRGGDLHTFDILLHAALERFSLLPKAVGRHFDTYRFYTCGSHERMSDAEREALWKALAQDLATGLDKVLADPLLTRGSGVDLSDRPTTMGERVGAICEALSQALQRGGDLNGLAARLSHEGSGTDAGYDGKQLVKLLAKRRVDTSALYHHVHHAKIVAENLHHLR